jgi:hypothetical protein
LPASLRAEVVNLSWDNDLLTGTDRGYTNGVRFSYLTDTADESDGKSARFARVLRDELRFLPGIGTVDSKQAVSLSLRQFMVTPEDITVKGPQFDDIPYAGHLSLSGTLWSWNADTITGFGAHIGVIGPESGAESVQKWVHKATGSDSRKGGGVSLEPMWWVAFRLRMAENSCNSGRAATLNSVCRWLDPDYCRVFGPPLKPGWSGSLADTFL